MHLIMSIRSWLATRRTWMKAKGHLVFFWLLDLFWNNRCLIAQKQNLNVELSKSSPSPEILSKGCQKQTPRLRREQESCIVGQLLTLMDGSKESSKSSTYWCLGMIFGGLKVLKLAGSITTIFNGQGPTHLASDFPPSLACEAINKNREVGDEAAFDHIAFSNIWLM